SCARRRDHPAARRHGTSPSRRTSLDRQFRPSPRRRQYRGSPPHQFSVASRRAANHGGAGFPVRTDDGVRGEGSSAGSACPSGHRAEVVDLASGWRAERASVGFTANLIMAGEVTCRIGGERKLYKAGEAWSAPAGTFLGEENSSASTARVFTTYLLPRGAGR